MKRCQQFVINFEPGSVDSTIDNPAFDKAVLPYLHGSRALLSYIVGEQIGAFHISVK